MPIFQMRKLGKVKLLPSFWIWEEEVLGMASPGPEQEATCVWVHGLGSWPVPAEEGARLWEDHGREDEMVQAQGLSLCSRQGYFCSSLWNSASPA